ncbi:MAG TPA: hypothetical protein VJ743_01875 [Albitalea sp.]|nr:hypothetical protein [Albitalea sp.]
MPRIVLFGLMDTLVDRQWRVFDHVQEALRAVQEFRDARGKPLPSGLVADSPAVAAPLAPIVDELVGRLADAGLRPFFEPVARRVTLSAHAAVPLPQLGIFETALKRLRRKASLADCLFITGNAAHARAASQALGMATLRFAPAGAEAADFDDWSQAPILIARRLDPANADNLQAAVRAYLSARGIDADMVQVDRSGGPWPVSGRRWHPVEVPGLGTVQVALALAGHVELQGNGQLAARLPPPQDSEIAEATDFARSLAAHGQIAGEGAPRGRTTHAIESGPGGARRLVRQRFSAV